MAVFCLKGKSNSVRFSMPSVINEDRKKEHVQVWLDSRYSCHMSTAGVSKGLRGSYMPEVEIEKRRPRRWKDEV